METHKTCDIRYMKLTSKDISDHQRSNKNVIVNKISMSIFSVAATFPFPSFVMLYYQNISTLDIPYIHSLIMVVMCASAFTKSETTVWN